MTLRFPLTKVCNYGNGRAASCHPDTPALDIASVIFAAGLLKVTEGASAGQGFGQAAEDAHALAVALREHGLAPEALRAYEDGRWQRAAKIGDTEQVLWAISQSCDT